MRGRVAFALPLMALVGEGCPAQKFQPSRGVFHPTPLCGATFSHEWEKGAPLLS